MTARITQAYRETLIRSHARSQDWGRGGLLWRSEVSGFLRDFGAKSVLDYGCGKGGLVRTLADSGFVASGYDPGIPEFSGDPAPSDFLICLDVLEHVEPGCLEAVLSHVASLAPVAFFVIATRAAKHVLPDGRNAHLIINPCGWWEDRLKKSYGDIRIVAPKRRSEIAFLCRI